LAPTNAAPIKLAADSAWFAKPPTHRRPGSQLATRLFSRRQQSPNDPGCTGVAPPLINHATV